MDRVGEQPDRATLLWAAASVQATIARCLKAVEQTYLDEANERLRLADELRRQGRH